jgi:hypothetical protein
MPTGRPRPSTTETSSGRTICTGSEKLRRTRAGARATCAAAGGWDSSSVAWAEAVGADAPASASAPSVAATSNAAGACGRRAGSRRRGAAAPGTARRYSDAPAA